MLRDAVVALLNGIVGIVLIANPSRWVGRGPFLTRGVVVWMSALCFLACVLATLAVLLRLST